MLNLEMNHAWIQFVHILEIKHVHRHRNLQIVVHCWAWLDTQNMYICTLPLQVSHITKVRKVQLLDGETVLQNVNCNLVALATRMREKFRLSKLFPLFLLFHSSPKTLVVFALLPLLFLSNDLLSLFLSFSFL